ncbi:MAG: hypothetical protein HQL82_01200 [Magnetococcales bacterium]|nr:hypothetical protein [Magnetococcales bacterium]
MTRLLATLLLCLWLPAPGRAEGGPPDGFRPLTRTVLAFYDGSRLKDGFRAGKVHRLAEMPLNHLGLVVRHHDLANPLPGRDELADVRGILLWMDTDRMANPDRFLEWLLAAMKSGIRVVLMGQEAYQQDPNGKPSPLRLVQAFHAHMGLRHQGGGWVEFTHGVTLKRYDPQITDFERPLTGVLPSFQEMYFNAERITPLLTARRDRSQEPEEILLAGVGPQGGFVAEGYSFFSDPTENFLQWYLNPFRFFRLAFATDELPKPDATTLSNRRIYYSHVDGDGWRNFTEVKKYRLKGYYSSEVLLKEVVAGFPDLPVTIGPVAADLDPAWYGSERLMQVAQDMFALPQVEAGSHTYSHPLFWAFFKDNDPRREEPFMILYPPRPVHDGIDRLMVAVGLKKPPQGHIPPDLTPGHLVPTKKGAGVEWTGQEAMPEDYKTPRVYALQPYDLDKEIAGSARFLETLAPAGKKVAIIQWSGNTMPYEAVLRATREAGMANLNGGDTRFDGDFPSVAWVSPLGRQVGREWQAYASSSNENTYTNLWTSRFFGFKHLLETVRNTESPRRLKPFNIYYHTYSADKTASLNALLNNLNYATSRPLAPIETSRFAAVTEGAIRARIAVDGTGRWAIQDRGALQTIRFDQATLRAVDFQRSVGVIGQRHLQGSLYVALDPAVAVPLIALRFHAATARRPAAPLPYLVEARWHLQQVERVGLATLRFQARGFGPGEMTWKMPQAGSYQATVTPVDAKDGSPRVAQARTDDQGLLTFTLPGPAIRPVTVEIKPASTAGKST